MANPDKSGGGRKAKPEHNVLVHGSIQACPPPEIAQQHNAERKEDNATHIAERKEDARRETKKFRVEVVTLAFVIIVAGLTALQVYYSRRAITDTGKQFQIDQRPYLWTTEIAPEMTIAKGQRMWANIPIADFGKAPALKTRITGKIFIGPTAKKDADGWFSALGDKPFTDPANSEVIVPPGIPTLFSRPDASKDSTKNAPIDTTKNTVSGLGGFGGVFFTILSDQVLTQADVDYTLNTEESAVFVIHLQYFDGFGNRYWSNVCMSRFVSGNIPHCTRHNEIH